MPIVISGGGNANTLAGTTPGATGLVSLAAATAAEGRTAIDAQQLDAELTALAGLTSAANKLPYFTGAGTASVADLTAVARTLLAAATVLAQQQALDLEPGVDVQAYSATLTSLATTGGARDFIYGTGQDGALTFNGTDAVTINGASVTPAAGVYTLASDVMATSITMSGTAVIAASGFAIYCTGALTGVAANIIHDDGNDASGSSAGGGLSGAACSTARSSTIGGAGRTTDGAGNVGGNNGSNAYGSAGSAGGASGAGNGGGAGGASSLNVTYGRMGQLDHGSYRQSGTAMNGGGGGGSGGRGAGGVGNSGGGGGGGGRLIVRARTMSGFAGILSAVGGAGGNAPGSTFVGGGGGGGGGYVGTTSDTTAAVIVATMAGGAGPDVSGGAPGSGAGGGSNGASAIAGNWRHICTSNA